MRTRFRLGISAAIIMFVASIPSTQAAIVVFGGGLGRDCYEAVEQKRMTTADALEICDMALEQERLKRNDRAATHVNRGILHMRAGRNDRALDDFERSLTLTPDLLEAQINIGAALYSMGRYPEALTALSTGIGTESKKARAVGYYNRALIHEKFGDPQSAYEDFRTALDLNPEFDSAARQLERFIVVPATEAN